MRLLGSSTHALAPILILATLAMASSSCGSIVLGQGTQSDPVPSGTLVVQGTFGGYNGRTVSGVAAVYLVTSGSPCYYTVRLQSLSAPTDGGLQVIPVVNGTTTSPTYYTLRSPTGDENYNFTTPSCGVSFTQILISNPALQPASARNYGIARFPNNE